MSYKIPNTSDVVMYPILTLIAQIIQLLKLVLRYQK